MVETQLELVQLLEDVRRSMQVHVRAVMEGHGLPVAAMAVLGQVRTDEGVTLSEVARRTTMAKSQVSTTVDGLVLQGLLEKRPDPHDQRLVRLYMTDAAHRLSQVVSQEIQARVSEALAGLSHDETETIAAGLRTLKAVLEKGQVAERA